MTSAGVLAKALQIDAAAEAERIAAAIRRDVGEFRRRGVVLGLSGGIDSSVAAALCVRALGEERVLGLLMPEQGSAEESLTLGRIVAEHFGIRTATEQITPILSATGCYARRDEAIRLVVPEYGDGWKCKLVFSIGLTRAGYPLPFLVVEGLDRVVRRMRLTPDAYLGVLAATNFKQRVRKMLEYYHADRWQYAVVGTPNRLEYDLGFFVKNGDGAADLKPIAHLYKSQVYQMASYLGVPEVVRSRTPTTDTYSLPQSQEEFFFSLPYAQMDLCLYGKNHGYSPPDVAAAAGLATELVERTYRDIDGKRRAAIDSCISNVSSKA